MGERPQEPGAPVGAPIASGGGLAGRGRGATGELAGGALAAGGGALAGPGQSDALRRENEHLRARLAALEEELVEVQALANAEVARWQERAYWLDRWHLDLNALMERPGAAELRGAVRALRFLYRMLRQAMRALRPPA